MDFKCILSAVVVLASFITPSSATCRVQSVVPDSCTYTILCEGHAGSAPNPNCENDPPNVTFIIKNTNYLSILSTRFFASTNFDSRVRTIKANENHWTTIDVAAFRYYSYCTNIDLSQNNIVNIATSAFKSLNQLQYLNLSSNRIETFSVDSFKISDNRNTALQILDLSNNILTELSTELNELTGLNQLYLQNNRLKTIADDAFIQLKSLHELHMRNNLLKYLNSTLIQLKMLSYLDVSQNNLTRLAGYEINRLVSLQEFNISHNSIVYVESNCFNQAFNLQKIDFSFNNINMSIENVMFINNNKLEYLNFESNNITGIDDNTFKHNNYIQQFNMESNFLSGNIKENMFVGLNNVTKLDLSMQNITGIKNKAFYDLKNLIYLNLSRNHISEVQNSSFSDTVITVLDLSYNNISNVHFLKEYLSNLTELYINNNNIDMIPENVFHGKNEIKKLDISMNKIKKLEANSLPLTSLQYLNLIGNQIQGNIRKNVFSPAKYLRFLNLSNFNITQIDNSAFIDSPVLTRLSLSNNQIETVDTNNFLGCENMYSLDISYNNISKFSFNSSTLRKLQALYLNNNKFTNVSRLFSNVSKLVYLDMSNNNIADNFIIGSDLLPNITTLHLANNSINLFTNPKTISLTTILDLRLALNKISYIDLSYYRDLLSIDLSNNNITSINFTFFEKNNGLQALDISQNNVNDIPPGTFRLMKNLKFLNISGNRLTKLRYGSLKGLHNTEFLDLSNNYITTLDVSLFHECDQLQTLIIDYNRIKTFDVESFIVFLKNLGSLSIGGNPISCKEMVQNVKPKRNESSLGQDIHVRQILVTSIDKIYHEDNVHGIRCGDDIDSTFGAITSSVNSQSATLNPSESHSKSSTSSTSVALIWCSVLTILLTGSGILVYFKIYKKRVVVVNMPLRNSVCSVDGSEFQVDLLR